MLYKNIYRDYYKNMKVPILAPSLLAANFSHLAEALGQIDGSGAEWTHLDVMDGNFVNEITFGPKMVKDLRPLSQSIFDVHLMITQPERHIEAFVNAGADYITFHHEAGLHIHRILGSIRDYGKKAGISIIPSTPVSAIEDILPFVDLILIMTVNPGFGGQKLITQCLEKIRTLFSLREKKGLSFLISADGGINPDTVSQVREAGTDILVAGEAFFKAPNKTAMAAILKGTGHNET